MLSISYLATPRNISCPPITLIETQSECLYGSVHCCRRFLLLTVSPFSFHSFFLSSVLPHTLDILLVTLTEQPTVC